MASSIATVQQAMLITKMLRKFGICEGQERLFEAMKNTHSFFAGGSVTAVAQAFVDGAADVDLKDGSDLDLWVPVFHPRAAPEACYKMLAMGQIDSALVALKFQEISTATSYKYYSFVSNPTTSYKYYSFVSNPIYRIASVKDYKHSVTGRKVQVIFVYRNEPDYLSSAMDILREFDISICRFYVTHNTHGPLLGSTDKTLFDDLKRRVFTINPVLRNTKQTAERVAKYYERGYHMEAQETCCSCKHMEIRTLTIDDAIGFVLAGDVKETTVKGTTSEPKNVVEVAPQTPPHRSPMPDCPPERKQQKPQLVVVASPAATGGGSAIAPSQSKEKPYARYYKDLKPLPDETRINVNMEINDHIHTVRMYESVLRSAMRSLTSWYPSNHRDDKHLLFWRGKTCCAEYVSDEFVEMIKEMADSAM